MGNNTAIIYARVSTVRQAEEELPIDSQLEACHKKAADLGVEVVRVFRDDGVSGRYDTRPAFQDAISYCRISPPAFFITWSSSRFARNIEDAILYKRRLAREDVRLIYCSMEIDTDTIGGFALDHIMSLFDDIYSKQVSEDTKRSMMKNARDGYYNGGGVPLGFAPILADDNPKRKRLQVVPDEADIVREIFKLKTHGHGIRAIALVMNGANKLNRRRTWNKTSISALLRNHAVIGKIVFDRKNSKTKKLNPKDKWVFIDAHEPIITLKLWEEVQSIMDKSTFNSDAGSPLSTHFFTGLLKCGVCGGSMQIETARGRSKRYSYYNCRNDQRSGSCEPRRIPSHDFDEWLINEIADEVFNAENLSQVVSQLNEACSLWATRRRDKKKKLLARLDQAESGNNKLFGIMEKLGVDTPNLGDLTKRLRANNLEIERVERELLGLEDEKPPQTTATQADVARLSSLLVGIIKSTDNPRKIRQFLGSFIKNVVVMGDSVKIEYWPHMITERPAVHRLSGWLPKPDVLGTKSMIFQLPERFCKKAA